MVAAWSAASDPVYHEGDSGGDTRHGYDLGEYGGNQYPGLLAIHRAGRRKDIYFKHGVATVALDDVSVVPLLPRDTVAERIDTRLSVAAKRQIAA